MLCKSLWIKASAKCINVNVNPNGCHEIRILIFLWQINAFYWCVCVCVCVFCRSLYLRRVFASVINSEFVKMYERSLTSGSKETPAAAEIPSKKRIRTHSQYTRTLTVSLTHTHTVSHTQSHTHTHLPQLLVEYLRALFWARFFFTHMRSRGGIIRKHNVYFNLYADNTQLCLTYVSQI